MQVRNIAWVLFSLLLVNEVAVAQQTLERLPKVKGPSTAANRSYGKVPLVFEPNLGQADPQVRFLFRGNAYTAFLTSGSMVLSLRPARVVRREQAVRAQNARTVAPTTNLQFRLSGAARNPVITGEGQQLGKLNYFIGNDRTKWRTNIPTYSRVRYKNVYPGIDLLYYGNHRQLEYDFVVAPKSDPNQIEFEIQGAETIRMDAAGNLVLKTAGGELEFQNPVVYQEAKGQRVPVRGGYVIKDATHIAFHVAKYDANQLLVIDPVLVYGTYLGGSGSDQASGVAVDGSGNVYLAGYTDSADFPSASLGSLPSSAVHVFVAKLDATGSNLVYADYIGGNSQDYGYGLVLDQTNHVYVTGSTASSDFPLVNPFQGIYPGSFNAFLTRISADGASLLYSTYLGGNGSDIPSGIAIDSLNDVLVAGNTTSSNFPVANAYQSTILPNGGGMFGNYGFVTKFNPGGSALVFSTYLSGNSNVADDCGGSACWPSPYTAINGIAVDANGNAYLTGGTNTYNFPTTTGAYLTTDSTQLNGTVGFVSKFSGAGALDYSTYFYEASGLLTNMNAIAVDSSGSAYVTGAAFSDGTFPVTTTGICDPEVDQIACSLAFVTKFDPTGSTLLYSTFLGPNNFARPVAIALDANNNAFIAATTSSNSFITINSIEPYSTGSDILLAEIDPTANSEVFATYLGGGGDDTPAGLAIDSSGNLYLAGSTDSTDLPTTGGVFQDLLAGNTDTFVLKIGQAVAPAVSLTPSSLQYTTQTVSTSSGLQTVLLRNMGSAPMAISSITASGDFAESNDCATSVAAAGSCTFSVSFTPTGAGDRPGSITIQDNAAGSPHVIALDGSGSGPVAVLNPTSLLFQGVMVGASSVTQSVSLTNNGNTTLNINGIQISGDYSETNTCSSALPATSTCSINVTFTPTVTGTRNGTLTVSDDAGGSPQTVLLTGSGSDFSLTGVPSSNTVKAGASASYTLTVSPVAGNFSNAVQLTCSGLPALTTCNLAPKSVTPGGVPVTVSVSISTTAAVTALRSEQNHPIYAALMALQGFGFFGVLLAGSRSSSRKLRIVVLLAFVIAASIVMTGCAGGTGITTPPQAGTNPGTYTVTITGTSGAVQHSVPLTLIVQ